MRIRIVLTEVCDHPAMFDSSSNLIFTIVGAVKGVPYRVGPRNIVA